MGNPDWIMVPRSVFRELRLADAACGRATPGCDQRWDRALADACSYEKAPTPPAAEPSEEEVERLYWAASSAFRFAGSRNAISSADEEFLLATIKRALRQPDQRVAAGGEASERDLARDDAETFGIGFEVDGKQVHPSRVVIHYPTRPIELDEQHRRSAEPAVQREEGE